MRESAKVVQRRRPRIFWIGLVIFAVWISFVVVSIVRGDGEQHYGAKSKDELRSQVLQALSNGDGKSLQKMLDPRTAGSDFGKQLVANFTSVHAGAVRVANSTAAGHDVLFVRAVVDHRQTCDAYAITTKDSWWMMSGTLVPGACTDV